MKIQHLALFAAALFAGTTTAQDATELTPEQILERFEAQLAERRAQREREQGLPAPERLRTQEIQRVERPVTPRAQVGDVDANLETEIGRVGFGTATPLQREFAHEDIRAQSESFAFNDEAGVREAHVLRFSSQAGADEYLVHGNFEAVLGGDFVLEQRGSYVAVITGPVVADPARAREALRQVWNSVAKADDNALIPPVRTRYGKQGNDLSIESEIDHPDFVESYDTLDYDDSDVTQTSHDDGVRRIHVGDEEAQGWAQGLALDDADRSPLRSRADETDFGRTRALNLGGGNAAPTKGMGRILLESGN